MTVPPKMPSVPQKTKNLFFTSDSLAGFHVPGKGGVPPGIHKKPLAGHEEQRTTAVFIAVLLDSRPPAPLYWLQTHGGESAVVHPEILP
jgi:hypothetical protein